MDLMSTLIQSAANELPRQCYMQMVGAAEELAALRDAIDRALSGSPAVVEFKSGAGVPCRMVIDRLGAPTLTQ
jgi:hypothetical protein